MLDTTSLFSAVGAFVVTLVAFTWCSFYASRVATRIRRALEQRHPDILSQVAPSASDHWTKHFGWQNDFNAVFPTLPLLSNIDDVDLSRDVVRLKWAMAASVPLLLVLFCAAVFFTRAVMS